MFEYATITKLKPGAAAGYKVEDNIRRVYLTNMFNVVEYLLKLTDDLDDNEAIQIVEGKR